ncbi:oxidoreductase, partial [Escherichia coli]
MRKVTSLSRGKLPFFFFALRKLELTMSIESLNAFSMDFFSLKGKTAIVTG